MILPAEQAETGWADDAPPPTATAATAVQPIPPPAPPVAAAGAPGVRPYRRRKLPYVIAFLALVAIAAAAGLALLSRVHFVGADDRGRVVVYQGVPWDIAGSLRLYRAAYVSPVLATQLSQEERLRLFDHGLHSKQNALAAVQVFERELLR